MTDEGGLSAEASASVSVRASQPLPYFPPLAMAGGDHTVMHPDRQVLLNGSQSRGYEVTSIDGTHTHTHTHVVYTSCLIQCESGLMSPLQLPWILHVPCVIMSTGCLLSPQGLLQYHWEVLAGPGPVNTEGASSSLLQVTHLEVTGFYLFRLNVTDSRGQSNSVNVSVAVVPEDGLPPVAEAGQDLTVHFPHTSAMLNGSASMADFLISSWEWTQIGYAPISDVCITYSGLHHVTGCVHWDKMEYEPSNTVLDPLSALP